MSKKCRRAAQSVHIKPRKIYVFSTNISRINYFLKYCIAPKHNTNITINISKGKTLKTVNKTVLVSTKKILFVLPAAIRQFLIFFFKKA